MTAIHVYAPGPSVVNAPKLYPAIVVNRAVYHHTDANYAVIHDSQEVGRARVPVHVKLRDAIIKAGALVYGGRGGEKLWPIFHPYLRIDDLEATHDIEQYFYLTPFRLSAVTGSSSAALNLAYRFVAPAGTIHLYGFDFSGGSYFNGEHKHWKRGTARELKCWAWIRARLATARPEVEVVHHKGRKGRIK